MEASSEVGIGPDWKSGQHLKRLRRFESYRFRPLEKSTEIGIGLVSKTSHRPQAGVSVRARLSPQNFLWKVPRQRGGTGLEPQGVGESWQGFDHSTLCIMIAQFWNWLLVTLGIRKPEPPHISINGMDLDINSDHLEIDAEHKD